MADIDLSDYSTNQQKVITEILEGDNNFHSGIYIAELPLYDMLQENEDDSTTVKKSAEVPLNIGSEDYTLSVRFSEEQKCWFVSFVYGDDEYNGILHFNTIYNPRGMFSFAIINDNTSDEINDVTSALPYSNVLFLRK